METLNFYQQEWVPVEGNTPWKWIHLPKDERFTFKESFIRDDRHKVDHIIFEKILASSKWNGIWENKTKMINIRFLPRKIYYISFSRTPISVIGLVSIGLNPRIILIKKRNPTKKELVNYFRALDLRHIIEPKKHKLIYQHKLVPIKEFIASHYYPGSLKIAKDLERVRKETQIENILEIMIHDQPNILFSPWMSKRRELEHIAQLIQYFYQLMKKEPKHRAQIKDLIELAEIAIEGHVPDSLDKLAERALHFYNMNLCYLIYNYKVVRNHSGHCREGIYLYSRYNSIPMVMHFMKYRETRILYGKNKNTYLNLERWNTLNDLWIMINDNETFPIPFGYTFINLLGKVSRDQKDVFQFKGKRTDFYFIVTVFRRRLYKQDRLHVNLFYTPWIHGSTRAKGLIRFKVYLKENI